MCASQRIHRAVARVRPHSGRAQGTTKLVTPFGRAQIVLQPIVSVHTGIALAAEALARFPGEPDSEAVFAKAAATGDGPALEAECLQAALRLRDELPESMLLTVNISPNALPYLAAAKAWPDDLHGVVVEITEQDVDRTVDVSELLSQLRERGAAIAIDDVSTGYAGLLRLAQMRPDYVKVDRQVVSGVGDSVAQAAVLEALVTLSHRLGAAVIGEGVESFDDLDALAEFDVDYAQGHAVGWPSEHLAPIAPEVVAACRSSRKRMLRGSSVGHAAARTRDVYAVTAALSGAGQRHDIDAAIAAAAADLGVDVIGVTILTNGLTLREIASTGEPLDTNSYALSDYPATAAVMNGGATVEVQVGDGEGDPAERLLLQALGHASLLLVPIYDIDRTIGVLEFAHRTPRRWSAHDIAHAQGLADQLSPVLKRLGVGTLAPTRSASRPA